MTQKMPPCTDLMGRKIKVGDYVIFGEKSTNVSSLQLGKVLEVPNTVDDDIELVINGKVNEYFKIQCFDISYYGDNVDQLRKPSRMRGDEGRFFIVNEEEGKQLEVYFKSKIDAWQAKCAASEAKRRFQLSPVQRRFEDHPHAHKGSWVKGNKVYIPNTFRALKNFSQRTKNDELVCNDENCPDLAQFPLV